ncbi:hypothetical protein TKK_0006489 [Trichogramma kaykai]|uniref:Tyrosinase copper-binding domain-containing protein n=1 Tax=Trichogramma kaykai TaxID=54128 RepID=A0ABD2XDF3_9HYME
MSSNRNLLLMFDRPTEPIYVPKGNQGTSFDIPQEYLRDEYQAQGMGIINRWTSLSSNVVTVKKIAIPDLTVPESLSRYETFSLFNPTHREYAAYMTKLFIGMRTVDDLVSLAAYCHDRINPQLFAYALSVAILHRPDTKDLSIPALSEIFPNKFFPSFAIRQVEVESLIMPIGPIEIPMDHTASDADPEHRVAYWREDLGINVHHYHWHLVYPFEGPLEVVDKDRRGELFYYMHRQILARYNAERLSNKLGCVRSMKNLRDPIFEAYYSKLDSSIAGRGYADRPTNVRLQDVDRPVDSTRVRLSELELRIKRVEDAVRTRQVLASDGRVIDLDACTGIDILGNMLEASILTPNKDYYGDIHNDLHSLIGYCHDPDHRYLESFSAIADPATSMRDPAFYPVHAWIDEMFTRFKDSFPAYAESELEFQGVHVTSLEIQTPEADKNILKTHWTKSRVDMTRGLAFISREPISVQIQHLNHETFHYELGVRNNIGREVEGTVRIFICPVRDDLGHKLTFEQQRGLMIEMDKFTVTLKNGFNRITRRSDESSITIPYESTFRDLNEDRPSQTDAERTLAFNFCGCGWPQHMLVPKGGVQGFPMMAFAMVSDYALDRVDQSVNSTCRTGVSYCGLRDRKYPDARPMGYPFDRKPKSSVKSLHDFLTPNMNVALITVKFSEVIKALKVPKEIIVTN